MNAIRKIEKTSKKILGTKAWIGELALPFCILLLCTIFSAFPFISYISLAAFLSWIIYIIIKRPPFLLKYLYVFFTAGSTIVGCFYIETTPGVWLIELQRTTSFAGSLPLLIFSNWLLIAGLLWFDSKWGCELDARLTMNGSRSHRINFALAWITFITVLIAFANVIFQPSFASGVDRFAFDNLHSNNLVLAISSKILPYLMISSALVVRDGKKWLGLSTVFLYCLFLFWTGEKFGGFFSLTCIFIFVFYDRLIEFAKRTTWKAIIAMVCGAMALVGIACFAYSLINTDSIEDFLEYRIAAQGQLWWSTYEDLDGASHFDELEDEFLALSKDGNDIAANVGSNYGIYKIMYYVAPQSLVDAKLARGSRYTSAGFAAAYYYGGFFGTIAFSIVLVFLIALITNGIIRALRSDKLITSILLFRLFTLSQIFFSMFLPSVLLEPVSLCILIWLYINWVCQIRMQKGRGIQKTPVGDDH